MTSEARILHVTIRVPMDRAYAFAQRPENFPRWAAGLADSLRSTERGWIADTPEGEAAIHFSEPNAFGILDHRVTRHGQPDVMVPMRMIPNGDGTEVELILFRQPDMTDADFKRDARMVKADLGALKTLLEAEA
ncbi:polyketide cyclase [Sphingomonas sp. Leaf412]|uniref:polyketide cyclase n=1 Tax=Sphingomonas sp. Leaf412 TaxID=1736370 RepID=UPI0006FF0A07|nr:polyketide cyclase [Sphingomonas sp. Leaf412]KQT32523.1 polyketide cyclase [Sphingomonas sp. Leaf412]